MEARREAPQACVVRSAADSYRARRRRCRLRYGPSAAETVLVAGKSDESGSSGTNPPRARDRGTNRRRRLGRIGRRSAAARLLVASAPGLAVEQLPQPQGRRPADRHRLGYPGEDEQRLIPRLPHPRSQGRQPDHQRPVEPLEAPRRVPAVPPSPERSPNHARRLADRSEPSCSSDRPRSRPRLRAERAPPPGRRR